MNKIYKVIYSKVRQCYVVVSEIAKSHGRHTKSSVAKSSVSLTAAVLLALGVVSFSSMPTAQATDSLFSNDYVGTNYKDENGRSYSANETPNYHGAGAEGVGSITLGLKSKSGKNTITIGDRNASAATESIYIGAKYDADNQVHPDSGKKVVSVGYGSDAAGTGSIAIGFGAAADTFDNAGHGENPDGSSKSIAIGYNANAKQNNIAIGANSIATATASTEVAAFTGQAASKSYVSVGDGTETSATQYRRITNVADGAADSDVATISQLKKAVEATDASKKANIDASNIGKNLKYKADGKTTADSSDIKTNEEDWGTAIGTGKVENGNGQLVTGGTVYTALDNQKKDLSVHAGWGIKVAKDKDGKAISLNRNLGRDMDTTDKATLEADESKSALVLGGRVEEGQSKKGQVVEKPYGAFGQDSVVVGGANNIANKDGSAAVVVGGTTNTASAQYSTVVGGNNNDAFGNESSVFGGFDNDAFGSHATLSGGSMNRAYGEAASVFGGGVNSALGASSVAVGGLQSTVNGAFAVGIAGGSTNADYALAAGNGANVTVENGTAIGYQATTDEAGTIAFGHDVGDVSGYTIKWKQRTDGKTNADGTTNDYTQAPESVVAKDPYTKAAYNRLVKVADGQDAHDVVVMEQLDKAKTELTKDLSVNAGWGIDVAEAENGGKTISLERNLGNNSTSVTQVSNTGLILGGDFSGTDQPDEQPDEKYGNYGATGQYAVTLGGRSNRASGESSVAAGGMDNTADGNQAFVGGGSQNTASGRLSSAIGGAKNTASGLQSSAFGGSQNTASGQLSSAIGGDRNTASGFQSSAIGGDQNTASGSQSSAIGGAKNIARGWHSSAFGGTDNISLDLLSSTLGGMNSVVLGYYATGIAGGSTGSNAWNALAAGSNSVVTVENGTAIGYQATTNEEGTIAFGHDKGDISGYTVTWKQKATSANGKYYDAKGVEITKDQYEALRNPDYTFNDYSKDPTITENTHKTAAYNRLVKVHDGKNAHDAVVMEQLKPYTKSDASNIGSNLKTYTVGDDGETITETDATEEQQKDNKDAWGLALGAGTFTTGTSDKATDASTSDQLVTGKTLYNYDKPTGTLNYVNVNNTTGQNLSALDAQVKANAVTLNDKTHNIKYYSVEDKISDDKLLPSISGYSNEKNDGAKGAGSMAAGFNTHADGIASTVAGSYSGVVGTGLQGATALSYGTFNINQNTDVTKEHSGVANSIIGQANATIDSNAAIIYGAGNTVTNSYRAIDPSKFDLSKVEQDIAKKDAAAVAKDLQEAVPTSGGQVMVMGGGNNVESAYMTQVTGVGNKVTGADSTYTEGTSTQYNFVDGFQNELTNGKHDYIIGSKNKVSGDSVDTNQSNIIFGDNHKLTNQKNNVIIGSSDTADDETTASNIVAIGHNAKVSAEGGVAIGSGSVASTAAGAVGYDPTGATAGSTSAWTSKKAAVSIGTAAETRQINGLAAGTEDTDAVNVAQLKKLEGMKANVNATNIGKNLKGADGKTAASDAEKTANENAWGTAIGTGEIAEGNGQLVTGKTVYAYNKPVAETGKTLNYVSADKTTGQNLTTLDEHVKTNADAIGTNTKNITTNTTNITKNAGDITNLKNLSNITDEGRTVIKNLSKDAVKVEAGDRVTVTSTDNKETGTITYKVSANNNGTVTAGDQNLVSGDTVNTAINNAITNAGTATDTKLAGKANVDASNIGVNLKGADGKAASAEAQKANAEKWGSAIGTGKIEKDNGQLVTGKTVYEYNKPIAENGKELNYVSEKKTTGQNLGALDSQVKTNADNIAKNTESIQDITNNMKNLGDNAVQYDKDSNKSKVTLGGKDGTVITNVKDGALRENSTDAVNGKQLYNEQKAREAADKAITEKVTNNTSEITKIKNGDFTDASKTAIHNIAKNAVEVVDGINTKAVKIEEGTDTTPTKYAVNVEGKGKVAAGDTGLISGDTLYKEVHIDKDGAYIKDSQSVGQNLSNLDTGLKTTSDLIHTNAKGDTIQIGGNSTATKIDISGKDKDGKSTGRVITGVVSDVNDPNSAANVGYVNGITSASNEQIYHDMNMQYNHVENDISRAAAGSNALAALHPMQEFDPDDKAQFALGYGHYRNSNAGAVGAFYQPDENSMVNFGVSFGNGDAGINAGVTFKFGPGGSGHHALTKTQMAKVIDAQSKEIDELKKDNADKDKRIDALEQKMTEILAKLDKSKD